MTCVKSEVFQSAQNGKSVLMFEKRCAPVEHCTEQHVCEAQGVCKVDMIIIIIIVNLSIFVNLVNKLSVPNVL